MNKPKLFLCMAGVAIPLGLTLWYFMPTSINKLNRMEYCACGYSEVKFENGTIVMINYHHDPGMKGKVIGSYTVSGDNVDIEIIFNNKKYNTLCRIDNIGLIYNGDFGREYYAVNVNSPKLYLHNFIKNFLR